MKTKPIIIRGGTLVCEDRILKNHDLILQEGKIVGMWPTQEPPLWEDALVVDARGAYVTPGMIDIHSDFIETVASPRPSVVMDLESSLYQAERELVSHGVTTIFHSLSLYQALIFDHKPIRDFSNVSKLMSLVNDMRGGEELTHLIRHRLHLRVELDAVRLYPTICEQIDQGHVDLLSFMDHTPGQGQYADLEIFSNTLKGYRDLSDAEITEIIRLQQQSNKLTMAHLTDLSKRAHARGIAIASHDDDSSEKLDVMEKLGTGISEFPITLDVAKDAGARGMHTLAGAPNVLMGHSHSGNLSAREAIAEQAIDILCSDYYPASMLQAVFELHRSCDLSLDEAFALVTINPARAVKLDDELGSIAPGKRGDILIVRELENGLPVVAQAYVGGSLVYRSHYPIHHADEANLAGALAASADQTPVLVEVV